MTATLTERSEGTAAHKGFNPKRKLENRDRAAVVGVKSNVTIVGARGTVRNNVLALAHLLQEASRVVRHNIIICGASALTSVKIASVVGARPQFIKAAPVSREIRQHHEEILVHTGQHYDENMSDVFFEVLDMPRPDYNLGVGSASHSRQTAEMMHGLEDVFDREKPDLVLVYGDTNSTLAGALVASKMGRPLGHVEAGLRSFNRSMPEEINRVVADHLSALLFCPTQTAVDNLTNEGVTHGVHLVGDVMYDVALQSAQAARSRDITERFGVKKGEYILVTLHRPASVDDRETPEGIIDALEKLNPSGRRSRSLGVAQAAEKTAGAFEKSGCPPHLLSRCRGWQARAPGLPRGDRGHRPRDRLWLRPKGAPFAHVRCRDSRGLRAPSRDLRVRVRPVLASRLRSRSVRPARLAAGALDVDHLRVRACLGDAHLPEPPGTHPDLARLGGANRELEMGDRVLRRRGGWSGRLSARAPPGSRPARRSVCRNLCGLRAVRAALPPGPGFPVPADPRGPFLPRDRGRRDLPRARGPARVPRASRHRMGGPRRSARVRLRDRAVVHAPPVAGRSWTSRPGRCPGRPRDVPRTTTNLP